MLFLRHAFKTIQISLKCMEYIRPSQEPLLLDGLPGAEMTSLLKIKIFLKSSFGVSVKVYFSRQKRFCKDMFIHFPSEHCFPVFSFIII